MKNRARYLSAASATGGAWRAAAAVLPLAAALGGCQSAAERPLSREQQTELASDILAFHICVAHAAAALDDRHAAIVAIAEMALDACRGQAKSVSTFLDKTEMSADDKTRYVDELMRIAADRSAVMLRRLRDREQGAREI